MLLNCFLESVDGDPFAGDAIDVFSLMLPEVIPTNGGFAMLKGRELVVKYLN